MAQPGEPLGQRVADQERQDGDGPAGAATGCRTGGQKAAALARTNAASAAAASVARAKRGDNPARRGTGPAGPCGGWPRRTGASRSRLATMGHGAGPTPCRPARAPPAPGGSPGPAARWGGQDGRQGRPRQGEHAVVQLDVVGQRDQRTAGREGGRRHGLTSLGNGSENPKRHRSTTHSSRRRGGRTEEDGRSGSPCPLRVSVVKLRGCSRSDQASPAPPAPAARLGFLVFRSRPTVDDIPAPGIVAGHVV